MTAMSGRMIEVRRRWIAVVIGAGLLALMAWGIADALLGGGGGAYPGPSGHGH